MKIIKWPREHILKVAFAVATAFCVSRIEFYSLDATVYDTEFRLKPAAPTSGNIEIVSIGFETVKELGHVPTAQEHLAFIASFKEAGAKALVYVINPSEISGTSSLLKNLSDMMVSLPNFFVGIDDTITATEDLSALRLPPPFDNVKTQMEPLSREKYVFARDGVSRRMMSSYLGVPTLELHLSKLFRPRLENSENIRGSYEFYRSQQNLINFHPTGTYPKTEFASLLKKNGNFSRFKDKVVYLGNDLNMTAMDYARTPYSDRVDAMTKPEVYANMLDTLIMNAAPIRSSPIVDVIISFLAGLVGLYAIFAKRPARGLLLFCGLIAAIALTALTVFVFFGIAIGLAETLITTFALFYIAIPFRLIVESRQRLTLVTRQAELASQASHDIRSPLVALNMVIKEIGALSPEKDLLVRNATKRINDIANHLLRESKKAPIEMTTTEDSPRPAELVMLSELVRNIIDEKRIQYSEKNQIAIRADLSNGFGLFVRTDPTALARVLSNLINNAVEACGDSGNVEMKLAHDLDSATISITDNGCGVPAKFLRQLGKKQINSDKIGDSGSGLGVLYAQTFASKQSGELKFEAGANGGTKVSLRMPRALAPYWFAENLKVRSTMAILDNDRSSSELLKQRLSISPGLFECIHFDSSHALMSWLEGRQPAGLGFILNLELLDSTAEGLNLIERFGISENSVLISNHSDTKTAQTRAEYLGVKLLPKILLDSLPLLVPGVPSDQANGRRKRFEQPANAVAQLKECP